MWVSPGGTHILPSNVSAPGGHSHWKVVWGHVALKTPFSDRPLYSSSGDPPFQRTPFLAPGTPLLFKKKVPEALRLKPGRHMPTQFFRVPPPRENANPSTFYITIVRGVARLSTSGGQETNISSFFLILLLFSPIFLNFSSFSSSI